MSILTPGQIGGYAASAGCPQSTLPLAIAIALGESSGNTQAHNPVGADDSYGLWQINMRGGLGPARKAQYGFSNNTDLYDPSLNARIMFDLSNGCTSWTPWGAYTDGGYRRYLAQAQTAVPDFGPADTTAPEGSALPSDVGQQPGGTTDATASTPFDLGSITSDLGGSDSGFPMWLILAAVGVTVWLVLR